MNYGQAKRAIIEQAPYVRKLYPRIGHRVLIENAGYGVELIMDLKRVLTGVTKISPRPRTATRSCAPRRRATTWRRAAAGCRGSAAERTRRSDPRRSSRPTSRTSSTPCALPQRRTRRRRGRLVAVHELARASRGHPPRPHELPVQAARSPRSRAVSETGRRGSETGGYLVPWHVIAEKQDIAELCPQRHDRGRAARHASPTAGGEDVRGGVVTAIEYAGDSEAWSAEKRTIPLAWRSAWLVGRDSIRRASSAEHHDPRPRPQATAERPASRRLDPARLGG